MCFGTRYREKSTNRSTSSAHLEKNEVVSSLKENSEKLRAQVNESTIQRDNALRYYHLCQTHHVTAFLEQARQHQRDIFFYSRLQEQFELATLRVQRARTDAEVIHEFMEATRKMLDRNGSSYIKNFDENAPEQREVLEKMMDFVDDIISESTSAVQENEDRISESTSPRRQSTIATSLRRLRFSQSSQGK